MGVRVEFCAAGMIVTPGAGRVGETAGGLQAVRYVNMETMMREVDDFIQHGSSFMFRFPAMQEHKPIHGRDQ